MPDEYGNSIEYIALKDQLGGFHGQICRNTKCCSCTMKGCYDCNRHPDYLRHIGRHPERTYKDNWEGINNAQTILRDDHRNCQE